MSDSENDSSGSDTGSSNKSSPASSAQSSRVSSANSSKPSSALSNKSVNSRISASSSRFAAAVMSRPGSQKSGAWSKSDPEKGIPAAKDEEKEKKQKTFQKEKNTLEAILEEELEVDNFKGPEPVGCWESFIKAEYFWRSEINQQDNLVNTKFCLLSKDNLFKGVSSLWSTSDLLNGDETEERVRTVTRELSVYIVFLGILCWVTLSATNVTMFEYTDMMKRLFEKQAEVEQVTDFWDFMENDFLDGIYWEKWYNKGNDPENLPCSKERKESKTKGPCPIEPKDRLIMYANRLLGVPRLRQLRVTNQSCLIPEDFKEAIKVCYDNYDRSIEDESDFFPSFDNFETFEKFPRKHTSADAWRYQNEKELDGHDVSGLLATYSGAGSIQDLKGERKVTKLILRELKEGLWIKRGTRYVSVDFTLYNANINYFCVITLNFEFPPSGGIVSSGEFTTVKLLRYITKSDYALMGAEFVFAIMVLYYLVEEVMEIKENKLAYFVSFWNCLDIFVILVSLATIIFNIYKYIHVNSLLKPLLAEPDLYADFAFLAYWSRNFQYAAGLAIFIAWIKVFKYISFNKTMSQLAGTITRSMPDLGGFSIMFFIIFFAYAQVAYLLFGPYVKDFSTLRDTTYTQLRLILGDFNFADIEQAHEVLGPMYFISYVFFVFFILMNMFMAILNDTYSEVKVEIENRKEDFQMLDFLKRGYNNTREIVAKRDKLIDIQTTIKLAADDGVVTFDEIRESLRKLNFSDVEIEIFCAKYDRDGNFEFDLEEINAIENGLELEMDGEQIEVEIPVIPGADQMKSEPPPPTPNQGMLTGLQQRVDKMESTMSTIAQKVNAVLGKLDQFEDNSRQLSAKVRKISSASVGEEDKRKQVEELVKQELEELES